MVAQHAMHALLHALADGQDLPPLQAERGFQMIMNGGATPAQMAAFLMGLRQKGETIQEITAGAKAMRLKAVPFAGVPGAIDTCGTGGDGKGTLNISTAVAFVLAACGVPVIKHGNRSVSSKSGSSDVLTQLGIKIDASQKVMQRALEKQHLCFLMAPLYHKAMRHIAPVRQELAMRTVFNLLGPLSNPAAPDYQLLGVYDKQWVEPMAHALKELGCKAAWVVYGAGGVDELSLAGASHVAELYDGEVHCFDVHPEEAGLETAPLEEIAGGDAAHNAQAMRQLFSGIKNAYSDAVAYNAAAGLLIAGRVKNLADGIEMAKEKLHSGDVLSTLNHFVDETNSSA